MRRFIIACGNGSIQMVDLDSDAESEYKFCSIDDMGNNNGACVHALLRLTTHINDLRAASASPVCEFCAHSRCAGRQLCAQDANGHERWRRKLERALRKNFPRDGDLRGKVRPRQPGSRMHMVFSQYVPASIFASMSAALVRAMPLPHQNVLFGIQCM